MGEEWTTGDELALQRLVDDRIPDAAIAASLGRTVSAIERKKHKLGLHQPLPDYIITRPDGAIERISNIVDYIEKNPELFGPDAVPARRGRACNGLTWALRKGKAWKGWRIQRVIATAKGIK